MVLAVLRYGDNSPCLTPFHSSRPDRMGEPCNSMRRGSCGSNRSAIRSKPFSIQCGALSLTQTPARTNHFWFGSETLPDSSRYSNRTKENGPPEIGEPWNWVSQVSHEDLTCRKRSALPTRRYSDTEALVSSPISLSPKPLLTLLVDTNLSHLPKSNRSCSGSVDFNSRTRRSVSISAKRILCFCVTSRSICEALAADLLDKCLGAHFVRHSEAGGCANANVATSKSCLAIICGGGRLHRVPIKRFLHIPKRPTKFGTGWLGVVLIQAPLTIPDTEPRESRSAIAGRHLKDSLQTWGLAPLDLRSTESIR